MSNIVNFEKLMNDITSGKALLQNYKILKDQVLISSHLNPNKREIIGISKYAKLVFNGSINLPIPYPTTHKLFDCIVVDEDTVCGWRYVTQKPKHKYSEYSQ